MAIAPSPAAPWLAAVTRHLAAAVLAVVLVLALAGAVIAKDGEHGLDSTCWWFWDPGAGAYVYDTAACPDGPDPGYPIDPDRVAPTLPDTALPR